MYFSFLSFSRRLVLSYELSVDTVLLPFSNRKSIKLTTSEVCLLARSPCLLGRARHLRPQVLASTAGATRYTFLSSLRGFDQNGNRIVMARPTLRERSPRGFPSLESPARPSTRELISVSTLPRGDSVRFHLSDPPNTIRASGSVFEFLLDDQVP